MNLINVFSVPMWEAYLPNFKNYQSDFLNLVYNLKNETINTSKDDLLNGWQISFNPKQYELLHPAFNFAAQMALKANFDMQFKNCSVFVTSARANILNNRNSCFFSHDHFDTYSGVLYIKAPPGSGNIIFQNPAINTQWQGMELIERRNKFNSRKIKIEPVEGKIYLWPSYLYHEIEPNKHDDERISISFEIVSLPSDNNFNYDSKNNSSDST